MPSSHSLATRCRPQSTMTLPTYAGILADPTLDVPVQLAGGARAKSAAALCMFDGRAALSATASSTDRSERGAVPVCAWAAAVGAHLPLIKAWGFRPTAMGFVLIKLRPLADPANFTLADLHTGTGFTTRKNAEYVVLCKRGKSLRRDAGVHEIIVTPRREHRGKPDELYHRIERYVGGEILELFARQSRPGWTTGAWKRQNSIRPAHRRRHEANTETKVLRMKILSGCVATVLLSVPGGARGRKLHEPMASASPP